MQERGFSNATGIPWFVEIWKIPVEMFRGDGGI